MTREQAIRKVLACLRLSKSSNPNEAAAALRHARALMDKYGLTEDDALASEIRDAEAKTGFRGGMLPKSMQALVNVVAGAYRCCPVITQGFKTTKIRFFGAGADAEVAAYAFTVLRRQLQAAKNKHTARIRKRANREARGEEFAFGWITAIRALLPGDDMPETLALTIDQAIKGRLGATQMAEGKEIGKHGRANWNDHFAGRAAAKDAHLHTGVSGGGQNQLEYSE